MAHALAKENEAFIRRMIRTGRYNNQSEVVRAALRRMELEDTDYLNPPPLTPAEAQRLFKPDPVRDRENSAFARGALRSLRRSRRSR